MAQHSPKTVASDTSFYAGGGFKQSPASHEIFTTQSNTSTRLGRKWFTKSMLVALSILLTSISSVRSE